MIKVIISDDRGKYELDDHSIPKNLSMSKLNFKINDIFKRNNLARSTKNHFTPETMSLMEPFATHLKDKKKTVQHSPVLIKPGVVAEKYQPKKAKKELMKKVSQSKVCLNVDILDTCKSDH